MRIADNTRLDTVLRDMANLQRRMLEASKQASTGTRLTAPSSDPVAAAQRVRIQAALGDTEGFRSALRTVRGDLELAEASLDSAHEVFTRLREIALQGADGALTASDRAALASEARQLKEELVRVANQKGSLGYLFGGTLDQTPPVTSAGVYQGNALERVAQIGPNQSMVVSANGALAFSNLGGLDVFAEVEALAVALDTNNQTAVSSSVNSMDSCRRQILAARVDAGTKLDRVDTADTAHQQAALALSTQGSHISDADPAESYSRLTALQSGLETSISVARTLLDTLSAQRF